MGDEEPEISILDARLAEIDQRLSRIQTGLAEDADAGDGLALGSAQRQSGARPIALAPALPPSRAPADDDGDDDPRLAAAELRGLIADHARLLDAMGELVASGERILARAAENAHAAAPRTPPLSPPAAAALPAPATPAGSGTLAVVAGPFASIDAVNKFKNAVRALPGVAAVEVRGYEGGDRAIVDVHLSGPTS